MYNLSALPFATEELLCLLVFIQTKWLSYDFIFFSSASLRYGENEKLPECIKQKLQCLSSILLMFSNPTPSFHWLKLLLDICLINNFFVRFQVTFLFYKTSSESLSVKENFNLYHKGCLSSNERTKQNGTWVTKCSGHRLK